jgi:hypothetical protein
MFKKVLIFGLVAVVVVAVAVSAYNVVAGSNNSDQSNLTSSDTASVAPLADPQASTRAQGNGSEAGVASQGSGWQSGSATQNAGQGNRYGQNGQGQGGQGQGGRGQGQGQAASQGAGAQQGVPNPQAAQNETVTLNGVVSNYAAPNFTLITDDGQSVAVQLGNQRYVSNQGIVLQEGEAVTLVGFYETSDSFAVSQITLDASGQTIALRDLTTGRPLWAGGGNNH